MSGIETAAAIAGIVGVLITGGETVQKWMQQRKRRSVEKANLTLRQSLSESGSAIENEYNTKLKQIGRRFSQGDGASPLTSITTSPWVRLNSAPVAVTLPHEAN